MPGKSRGQGSLVGYSPWGLKESDTTEQLHFHFQSWRKVGIPTQWLEKCEPDHIADQDSIIPSIPLSPRQSRTFRGSRCPSWLWSTHRKTLFEREASTDFSHQYPESPNAEFSGQNWCGEEKKHEDKMAFSTFSQRPRLWDSLPQIASDLSESQNRL